MNAERNYAVAPGEWIAEWLEENQVTVPGLAHQLGVSPSYVVALLTGEIAVSKSLAQALEDITDIPARSWLRWEIQYLMDKARLAEEAP